MHMIHFSDIMRESYHPVDFKEYLLMLPIRTHPFDRFVIEVLEGNKDLSI